MANLWSFKSPIFYFDPHGNFRPSGPKVLNRLSQGNLGGKGHEVDPRPWPLCSQGCFFTKQRLRSDPFLLFFSWVVSLLSWVD